MSLRKHGLRLWDSVTPPITEEQTRISTSALARALPDDVEAAKDFGSNRPLTVERLVLDSPRTKFVDDRLCDLGVVLSTAFAKLATMFANVVTQARLKFSSEVEKRESGATSKHIPRFDFIDDHPLRKPTVHRSSPAPKDNRCQIQNLWCHRCMRKSMTRPTQIHELRGWPVHLLGHQTVDRELPYRLMGGGNLRRHVAYAVLSTVAGNYRNLLLGMTDEEVACEHRRAALERVCMLLRLRPRDAITSAFGSCPPGLLGALARTARRVQPVPYYRWLFDVFADHGRQAEARVLLHVPEIDVGVLAALANLPPGLRHPDVLSMVREGGVATKIAIAARLLAPLHPLFADDRQLFGAGSAAIDPRRLIINAVKRIDTSLPPPPLRLSGFRHIDSTAELRTTARRYRNCLGEAWMIAACISGQRAVYEALDHAVLVEIARLDGGGVVLLGVNGVGNQPIADHVHGAIVARLWRQGVERHRRGALLSSEWDVIDAIETLLRREERPVEFDLLPGLDFAEDFKIAS